MGSSTSKENNTNYIDKINEINIDDLDLSKIDNLQLKAIKELGNKIKEIEKKKSDRIMYKLPAINICAPSLIYVYLKYY